MSRAIHLRYTVTDEIHSLRLVYSRVIDLLVRGEAFEIALEVCRELQREYDATGNLFRLSRLHSLMAKLYIDSVKANRETKYVVGSCLSSSSHWTDKPSSSTFFLVEYRGLDWPLSLRDKQYVYSTRQAEDFVQQTLLAHPGAVLLSARTSSIGPPVISKSLHIERVNPEYDSGLGVGAGRQMYTKTFHINKNIEASGDASLPEALGRIKQTVRSLSLAPCCSSELMRERRWLRLSFVRMHSPPCFVAQKLHKQVSQNSV